MLDHSNEISKKHIQSTYKAYAPLYDLIFGAILEPGRKALAQEVKNINPEKILEIGVGTGILLDKYPKKSLITGIDISEEMLSIAQKKVNLLSGTKIELINMDAENLAFENNSFDCVVLPYVLSVTPHPEILITEIRRVCKKDGVIIIINHFSGSKFWWLLESLVKNFAKKIGFRSEFSYADHVLAHDWNVIKSYSVNLFGLSKLVMIKN